MINFALQYFVSMCRVYIPVSAEGSITSKSCTAAPLAEAPLQKTCTRASTTRFSKPVAIPKMPREKLS